VVRRRKQGQEKKQKLLGLSTNCVVILSIKAALVLNAGKKKAHVIMLIYLHASGAVTAAVCVSMMHC